MRVATSAEVVYRVASVPSNTNRYCLPLAFQSIGMALAAAIGTAVATPDRLTVAGIGDGGFMMCLTELDTAVRLALPLVVVVYDDAAYGAEVHHFTDHPCDTVVFPDTDLAAIARGFGCTGMTGRGPRAGTGLARRATHHAARHRRQDHQLPVVGSGALLRRRVMTRGLDPQARKDYDYGAVQKLTPMTKSFIAEAVPVPDGRPLQRQRRTSDDVRAGSGIGVTAAIPPAT